MPPYVLGGAICTAGQTRLQLGKGTYLKFLTLILKIGLINYRVSNVVLHIPKERYTPQISTQVHLTKQD